MEVRLMILRLSGARIEHGEPLRPGSLCAFQLPPALGSVVLSAEVVQSTVIGTTPMPGGDRQLCYQSGLAFVNVTPEQRAALKEIVMRRIPEGGVENAQLIF
jgi:hypothetical protein